MYKLLAGQVTFDLAIFVNPRKKERKVSRGRGKGRQGRDEGTGYGTRRFSSIAGGPELAAVLSVVN